MEPAVRQCCSITYGFYLCFKEEVLEESGFPAIVLTDKYACTRGQDRLRDRVGVDRSSRVTPTLAGRLTTL